jgi:hypothetical protein
MHLLAIHKQDGHFDTAVNLVTCIRSVSGSNLGQNTCVSQSFETDCGIVPKTDHDRFLSQPVRLTTLSDLILHKEMSHTGPYIVGRNVTGKVVKS